MDLIVIIAMVDDAELSWMEQAATGPDTMLDSVVSSALRVVQSNLAVPLSPTNPQVGDQMELHSNYFPGMASELAQLKTENAKLRAQLQALSMRAAD